MDPYKVVGVLHTATAEEIKRAFRVKARLLHPDKGQEVSGEKFRELVYARDLLLKEKVFPAANNCGTTAFTPFTPFAPFGFPQTTFFQPPPRPPPFDYATFFSTFFPQVGPLPGVMPGAVPGVIPGVVPGVRMGAEEKKWKQYFFQGKHVTQRAKEYTNVSTNRIIKNLDRPRFLFLDVGESDGKRDGKSNKNSETRKGPRFCGDKAAMKEFCRYNNLDFSWIT